MVLSIVLIVVAIALLYFGAEFSLEASEKVGAHLGLSPLAIGMLLIGFGTSLPEFFVGHIAGSRGESGIALGSLVGSNIANLFLILGVSGFIAKLHTSGKSLKEHLFIHLLLCLTLFFVLTRAVLSLASTAPLFVVLGLYLFFIFKDLKRSHKKIENTELQDSKISAVLVLKMGIGFFFLYLGGELLVKGGVDLGAVVGVDSYIISSIFIAFGTSFPELVTAVMATLKKKDTDIVIGNIIGSNLFNCAFILGSLGIYEFQVSGSYFFELYALLGGGLFLVFLSAMKKELHRLSSVIFFSVYLGVVGHWLKII